MLIFAQAAALQLWALRPSKDTTVWCLYQLSVVARILYYYAIHVGPYTSAHPSICTEQNGQEIALVLCCQNQVYRGTGQQYWLHNSVNISVHSASIAMLGLLKMMMKKKKESVQNGVFAIFQVSYLKHSNCSCKWL